MFLVDEKWKQNICSYGIVFQSEGDSTRVSESSEPNPPANSSVSFRLCCVSPPPPPPPLWNAAAMSTIPLASTPRNIWLFGSSHRKDDGVYFSIAWFGVQSWTLLWPIEGGEPDWAPYQSPAFKIPCLFPFTVFHLCHWQGKNCPGYHVVHLESMHFSWPQLRSADLSSDQLISDGVVHSCLRNGSSKPIYSLMDHYFIDKTNNVHSPRKHNTSILLK